MRKKIRGVAKAIECVKKCSEKTRQAKCFVECYLGNSVKEAYLWVDRLKEISEQVKKLYGFYTITYSREFRSFIEEPLRHLEKKLFIYSHDYRRGKLSLEEYAEKSMMAINTSLRTNLRTLYQNWGFLALLINIYREGAIIIYPEHNVLNLERSGKQKLRWIPPNLVLDIPGYGSISLFIEAPRPLAWGDTGDLEKIWGLYTALRPDMMVYGGRIYDIVDPENSPPVKRPDLIIEFKELPDWYKRIRDVRGPLAKPLSAEEWRNRWIEGLWDGLADVLGVTRHEVAEKISKRRGVRLNEVRVVQLYKSVYNPDKLFLVSKHVVPEEIRKMLESHDIIVIDDVGFNRDKLGDLSKNILEYAEQVGEYIIRVRDRELASILQMIIDLWGKKVLDREKIRKLLLYSISEDL
ncbi:hypothetical protein [Staphylothermus hellenicus]|uniref:Uncharacterized protein n=1 Tax=Staphylothermus hellenicus (strain DSM 12710 / JCM 10830 / BK20S6-10-b1 / P8) TaxID=591019 RepID=D7DCA5_STAHD|nr:hypothetical protein [Staphylothermus hellenicus]ADI31802.1 hypothetical protein Shell_0679 [Staphylothermus hellenicus DSM 12710]